MTEKSMSDKTEKNTDNMTENITTENITTDKMTTENAAKERLARLIDVKSLVTLALVAVLCGMTLGGRETGEIFNSAVMLVLGFFFGKKTDGSKGENK